MAANILVIVPCFNEADSIERVILDVRENLPGGTILVVDDGSADETARVAAKLTKTLRLPVNLGIGGAVQTGFRFAVRHNFDYCVQVDGDGQHLGREISKLVRAHESTQANIIIGTRFLGSSEFRSTFVRRIGIAVIRRVSCLVSGQWITDPTSGFRLFDRKALTLFNMDYPSDYPEPVSILLARLNGLTIAEVGTEMKDRVSGKSSIAPLTYMFRVCSYLLFFKFRKLLRS